MPTIVKTKRNNDIYIARKNGEELLSLSFKYNLTVERIRQIYLNTKRNKEYKSTEWGKWLPRRVYRILMDKWKDRNIEEVLQFPREKFKRVRGLGERSIALIISHQRKVNG